MNVTNLSTEERIRLFNEWLEFREKYKDLEDFSQDNLGYYLEGKSNTLRPISVESVIPVGYEEI